MTEQTYKKAVEIKEELHKWNTLFFMTFKPYKKYYLVKKFLWITNCDDTEAIMCDSGLNELIRKYSEEKIAELEKQFEAL